MRTEKMKVLDPPGGGRLWYDNEIAEAFLNGLPGVKDHVRWIRTHFPRHQRVRVGRRSAWYENDIIDHITGARGGRLQSGPTS